MARRLTIITTHRRVLDGGYDRLGAECFTISYAHITVEYRVLRGFVFWNGVMVMVVYTYVLIFSQQLEGLPFLF